MPKITAIVFFVAVTDFLAFFYKYIVDLLDIFLHLSSHPLALLGKQVLCILPVDISNIGRDLQFCRCIFHDSVNMLVDVVKLTTDGIYGITQFKLGSLILLDRFILKCGIHNTVFRITIKVTVTIFACYFIWSVPHTSIDVGVLGFPMPE